MFDVNKPESYIGVGSNFEKAYRPDQMSINQAREKVISAGDALPPGSEALSFDPARKRAFLGAGVQMLSRGKEKDEYAKLPKGTPQQPVVYSVYDYTAKRWLVKQKVD